MAGLTQPSSDETFIALLAAAFASFVLLYYYAEARKRKHLPPGPWPWPVVGNFLALGDMPHQLLHKLAAKYGGLMYLRLGSKPCIVISTAAIAKEFYKTADANFVARPKRLAWTVWHNGNESYKVLTITSNLPYWRCLRRLFNTELFSPGRHASYQGVRAAEIQYMMKILVEEAKKGDAVDIKAWLYGVTCNTMTRIVTGKRYFGTSEVGIEKEREDFVKMNTTLSDLFGAMVISDFVPYLSFVTRLQGHAAKFAKISDFSKELTHKMFDIESHRQRYKERRNDPSYVPDLEDVLLETPLDDGMFLPDKDILKILQELLNAGTETSSTLIGWTMAELVMRPDLIKRAQDELDNVVQHAKRLVEESDLPNLPFLQALIKEAFRLHPPIPLLVPHESHQASEFLGYQFPTGTTLIMNSFAIHRDPSVYKNPEVFDPEKFLLAHPEVNHLSANDSYELLPFGAGRRVCPAYNLGNTVGSLMLANLLFVFDWSLPAGQSTVDMSEVNGLSLGMKTPLCLVAKPRFNP